MNNEEKILSMLETVTSEIKHINVRLEKLESGQAKLESGQAKLESGQAKLESGQAKLEIGQAKLESGQAKLEIGQAKLESDMEIIRGSVVRIEHEHGKKLDALFDGYQQLDSKVTRIEEHVSAQDDVILKRVFPKAMEK